MTHVADAERLPRDAIVHVSSTELPCRVRLLVAVRNFVALRRRLGRSGADRVAEALAQRIATTLATADVHAISRDLVEVTIDGAVGPDALDHALAAVRTACDRPIEIDDRCCTVIVSVAGATGAIGGDEVALCEATEARLAEACGGEPGGGLMHVASEAQSIAIELERAIAEDELMLMYQPKIQVRRQEITSAEALIRWRHPERGMIFPGDFIPAAEQAQTIDRLTLWTVERAIRDQRTLRERGHPLRIFINISGQLLADPRFVAEVCALVQAAPDTSIGFEVTETSVIRDPAGAIANLKRFDEIGIRISIDDYGAGLSSLAYLKQLPARELKIDKLFVTQLTSSNRDPLIVRSTIDLAHALDMEVVAEGVETAAALALLSVMGCDMVQGYFISRPIALEALVDFLRDDTRRHTTQDTRTSFLRLASAWKRA
ncbi:EAL domain-containing protein [Sphingomonas adhaesiva]|uniref:EAL domain-containing protein n=1 Tax=Sphingomonas adhaesiva TaxID=28212 RepID=UPI002FF8A715